MWLALGHERERNGCLLVLPGSHALDFAPHQLEFLREQSAHRRLGFASDQLKRWLKESGLSVERQREYRGNQSSRGDP